MPMIELGKVLGGIPIRMGSIYALLIVIEKGICIYIPPLKAKEILLPSKIVRLREIVKLAKMDPEDLLKNITSIEGEKKRFVGCILKNQITSIELKKGLLGALNLVIYTSDGSKLKYGLIYGKGTGISKEEVVTHTLSILNKLGVKVVKNM